jgi:hypothetical protein
VGVGGGKPGVHPLNGGAERMALAPLSCSEQAKTGRWGVAWSQDTLPKLIRPYFDCIFNDKAPLQSPMLIVSTKPEESAALKSDDVTMH